MISKKKKKKVVDMGLCTRCKKNKATITFANSILDWTHGFAEYICKDCYKAQLEKQVKSCRAMLKTINDEKKVKKNGKKRI
jgi:protein-arginine kinase activator protein McsA